MKKVEMHKVREALEASWKQETAYQHVYEEGNPALGQCYPTARVVQHYFPEVKVVRGFVWTGKKNEIHFWNVLEVDGVEYHIDFSWRQFPPGSAVRRYGPLDENDPDSEVTLQRIDTLLGWAQDYLAEHE